MQAYKHASQKSSEGPHVYLLDKTMGAFLRERHEGVVRGACPPSQAPVDSQMNYVTQSLASGSSPERGNNYKNEL